MVGAKILRSLCDHWSEGPKKLGTLSGVVNTSRLDWHRPTTNDTVAGGEYKLLYLRSFATFFVFNVKFTVLKLSKPLTTSLT